MFALAHAPHQNARSSCCRGPRRRGLRSAAAGSRRGSRRRPLDQRERRRRCFGGLPPAVLRLHCRPESPGRRRACRLPAVPRPRLLDYRTRAQPVHPVHRPGTDGQPVALGGCVVRRHAIPMARHRDHRRRHRACRWPQRHGHKWRVDQREYLRTNGRKRLWAHRRSIPARPSHRAVPVHLRRVTGPRRALHDSQPTARNLCRPFRSQRRKRKRAVTDVPIRVLRGITSPRGCATHRGEGGRGC